MSNRVIDFRYAPDVNQTCISFPDDEFKGLVREDGSINYVWQPQYSAFYDGAQDPCLATRKTVADQNLAFKYRYVPRFYHRDRLLSREQKFDDPRLAIVTTKETYEHTVLEWTVFAYRREDGLRADFIVYKMQADEAFGCARSNVYLQALGETDGEPAIIMTPLTQNGAENAGEKFLRAGDVWEGAVAFVHWGNLTDFTLDFAKRALAEMTAYWQELRPFKNTFRIPDKGIQDMLEACGRNILQARAIDNETYEYRVGSTMYRGLWMVDGYFINDCAYMMGHTEEAFQGVLAVQKRSKPNGSIRILPGHDKETGIALAAFVRHCELKNDDDKLRELWPTMVRGMQYLKDLHEQAAMLGEDYLGRDLFPPALGDGGIFGETPEYTTPCWVLFGLKKAYEAGIRLGLPHADEFKALFDDIYDGFIRSCDRDRVLTADGIPYVPMTMKPDPKYQPQTGTWALAQAIAPGEVFAPDNRIVTDLLTLLDSVDDDEGLPVNTGWRTYDACWPYSAMFYGEVWLYAGRPDKAVDYLYAFANHASPSRVWREEQPLLGSPSPLTCGDMPHNWGSAEFIRLTRNLLILEKEGNVELLRGLPEEWLPTPDCDLEIAASPTRYGAFSVKMQAKDAAYRLTVSRTEGCLSERQVLLYWNGRVEGAGVTPCGEGVWLLDAAQSAFDLMLTR